jgi:hypothetical protein
MGIEDINASSEHIEGYEDAIVWLQEQGLTVTTKRPESIKEAVAILEEESARTGEDPLAAAPASLNKLLKSLETNVATSEAAPLPYAEMATYLSEKTDQEIGPDDTALMLTIYKNLKAEVAPASGVFDTHPETDALYDLPIRLQDAFERMLEEAETLPYKNVA